MNERDSFYRTQRAVTPLGDMKRIGEYDIEGADLQSLQQQNPDILYNLILDLSVARAITDPLVVQCPGRAAVIYGYSSATQYDGTAAATGVEVSEPATFIVCRVNSNRAENSFHMKHNRGFHGTFNSLWLSWPAQANIKARLVVFKGDAYPWMSAEADNRFNSVEASNSSDQTVVSVGNTATVVCAAKISRKCCTIFNNAATTIYLLGNDSAGTAANGIPLLQYSAAFWRNTGPMYAITAAGTNADIRVLEEW